MAVTPTRLLEVEFDPGVWTDIAADVVDISTRRGRNKESGAFETGQLIFTVRNDDRRYDPDHTGGPYYGKLRPNRRVRLRATYNAVTYPIFVGYIDRIAQQYGGPNDATAEFQVSDIFKILNRVELPTSAYAAEVADDGPRNWWRLGDTNTSTTAVDATGGADGTYVGAPELGAPSLVVREPDTALETTANGQGVIIAAASWGPITGRPLTIEAWVMTTTPGSIFSIYDATRAYGIVFAVQFGTGKLSFNITSTTHAQSVALGTANVADGAPHLVAVVWDAAGNVTFYVDGAADPFSFSAGPFPNAGTLPTSGQHAVIATPLSGASGYIGILDEVAFYDAALSAGRIAAHNTTGRTPWNGDDPGTRLVRVLETLPVTTSSVVGAGTTELQATSLGGSALGYAQKIEETERGWLFVNAEGDITFIGREEGNTGAYLTSRATFVDDDSGAGIPYRSVSADVDEARLVTRATVSREGSVAVTWQDDAAIAEYQIVDETHEGLLHADDAYSLSYAQYLVNTYKAPATRVGTVTVDPTKDPAAMYPALLGLELADRVTYKRKPQNTGAVTTIDMRVDGISHETGGHYWRTRLQLSPIILSGGADWLLGVAGRTELGATTRLGL